MNSFEIKHFPEKKRFEMEVEGQIATVSYTLEDETLYLVHSEIPAALRGRGMGKILVEAAFEYIKKNDLKAVPICSFIRKVAREGNKWNENIAL
ncbi:MAG: putative GNAT family acetyltransferase [Maribacter sp.]|jgi:predicted GNAT family acetyltransferase